MKVVKEKNTKETIFSGIAGEYFVAGELSRRRYIATVSLRNTAHVDILVSDGKKALNIQVKTKRKKKSNGWDMGNKPLKANKEWQDTFYIFVELPKELDEKIKYFIIPKNELNKKVETQHQTWLRGKNKLNGKPRTSQRRIFRIDEYPEFNTNKYEDNWNQLFNC